MLTCGQISGETFRPLFGQAWSPERLEVAVRQVHSVPAEAFQRRPDGDHIALYWQKAGAWFGAGLQKDELLYVNLSFEPEEVTVGEVLACLGAPEGYQAWCDVYARFNMSSVQAALVFPPRLAIAYAVQHLSYAPEKPPAIGPDMPISHITLFGRQWAEDERILAGARPWPGNWRDVEIELTRHDEGPEDEPEAGVGGADSANGPAPSIEEALDRISQAFANVPRPPDDELLHAEARDDGDIKGLFGVRHWRELPEAAVEGEYAALFFLSPAGFRHFLPAYMSWVLRHPKSGAAVVGSTIFALTPARGDLAAFSRSKFSLFNTAQRAAVLAFLEAMSPYEDVVPASAYWRGHPATD